MKNKRILSLVLAFAMLLGTFSFAFADEANIPEEIQWLIDEGYVLGDDGGYRLGDNITRAEVAVIVAKALGLEDAAKAAQPVKGQFKDVPAGRWDNGFINVLAGKGILNGYPDGTFKANNKISNAEVVTIMVMMIDGKVPEGGKYPFNMIARATELGLFNGTNIADYSKDATRQDTFMLIYNALMNLEIGKYSVIKGIVLENYRVESIGKNEIVVEVIRELQRSQYADESRKEKGDQIKLTVPADVADVEDLLGKVADFTIDRNDKVVRVKEDDSYKVEIGKIAADKTSLTINRTRYTVSLDERYDRTDERIFRSYFNNDSLRYEDFYKDKDANKAEYARVTVKNGKVLFIDAFQFEDIAPVKEVKDEGKVVYIYDDARDGAAKKLEFGSRAKVVKIDGKQMKVASLEDIEALDVIHYVGNTVFVKKDAKVEGKYEKYRTGKIDEYPAVDVYVDEEAYPVVFPGMSSKRMPVFSFDGENFETLKNVAGLGAKLEALRDKEVTLLLDMNGRVQFIASGIKDPTFYALVDNILRGDVRFEKADGEREIYSATMDTKIDGISEGTRYRDLYEFRAGDLVTAKTSDDELTNLTMIATRDSMIKNGNNVESMNRDKITLQDGKSFYLEADTIVFVNTARTRKGMTVSEFLNDYDVKPVVDKDGVKTYNGRVYVAKDDGKVANVLVFTDAKAKATLTKDAVVKVVGIDGYDALTYYMMVEDAAGNETRHFVAKDDAKGVHEGDIISVKLSRDDKENIEGVVDILIPYNAPVYKVANITRRYIKLEDRHGNVQERYLLNSADEFGEIAVDEFVSIPAGGNDGDAIDVIVERTLGYRYGDNIWGEWAKAPDEPVKGVVTYINTDAGYESFAVDKKTPYFLNDKTILTDKDNNVEAMGAQAVIKKLGKGDQVEVTIKGDVMTIKRLNTKDELAAAPVIDKINALPKAEEITKENLADNKTKVEAARKAYNALTKEQKALVDTAKLEAAEKKIAELEKPVGPESTKVKDVTDYSVSDPANNKNCLVVLKMAELKKIEAFKDIDENTVLVLKIGDKVIAELKYDAEDAGYGNFQVAGYTVEELKEAVVEIKK